MRRLFIVSIALGALALAGCESGDSLPTRIRERFEPVQPKIRVFDADQRTVFDAAQVAMRRIDFQVSRARAVEGVVSGHSGLRSGESFGTAQQFSLEVHLQSVEPGKTEVSVVLREQEESSSFAGATDIPVREHGLYDAFFGQLEQVLREKNPTAAEPAK